jgi:hypothetical protein
MRDNVFFFYMLFFHQVMPNHDHLPELNQCQYQTCEMKRKRNKLKLVKIKFSTNCTSSALHYACIFTAENIIFGL